MELFDYNINDYTFALFSDLLSVKGLKKFSSLFNQKL